MRKLLLLAFMLCAYIGAVHAYEKCYFINSPWNDPNKTKYASADSICSALVTASNSANGYSQVFLYAKEDKEKGANAWACMIHARPESTTESVFTWVYKYCKEEEAVCKKGDVEKRIFDWVKNKSDQYDLKKAPPYMSFEGCEYKREVTRITFGEKGKCKFPVKVDYIATGEKRDDPIFDDVKEKCTDDPTDPDDDDPDTVTPGNLPNIRDLYDPEYPEGIIGVLKDIQGKLKETSAAKFISASTSPPNVASGCLWTQNIQLDFGVVNMGEHNFKIECEVLTALKAIVLLSALLAARRIIFGG